MGKSPWDGNAIFLFFSHFSVPSQNSASFSKFSCCSPYPHPIQTWNSEKILDTRVQHCGVRGGAVPVWIGKRPRNAKCPKTFVRDCSRWFIRLSCWWIESHFPKARDRVSGKLFPIKDFELVSGKLSKCLYIDSYTHLWLHPPLTIECLLAHNFQNSCSTECH